MLAPSGAGSKKNATTATDTARCISDLLTIQRGSEHCGQYRLLFPHAQERWEDGHESINFPADDAVIRHPRARRARTS